MPDNALKNNLEGIISLYENPTERDYKQYYDYLRGYNLQIHKELEDFIIRKENKNKDRDEKGFIGVVGSDARLEKGKKSPIELLIVKTNKDSLSALCEEIKKRSQIFSETEIKSLDGSMMYYNNEKNKLHPSRMIDAVFIYGKYEVFKKAKEKLLTELEKEKRKVTRKIKERIRYFHKILLSGKNKFKGQEVIHYDLEKGVAYYDEENYILSFKAGPLRYIQNMLTLYVIKSVSNKELSFLLNLPSNTSDRIYFLSFTKEWNLTPTEIEELIDSYKYFLKEYHLSQVHHHDHRQKERAFDRNEVRERIYGIEKILKGNKMFEKF